MPAVLDTGHALEAPAGGGVSLLTQPLAPSVVIGLGNEIAGDDGVGIHVARLLQQSMHQRPDVDVIGLPWAGFALLDALRGRRWAGIVDCLVTGRQPPGTVVQLDEHHFDGSVRLNSFHDISFTTVMALGRRMGWDMPGHVVIWGIEGGRLGEFVEGLSPAVAMAADHVIAEITRHLEEAP